MGPVIQAWAAWATAPDIRFAGSSGGALAALGAWRVETGQTSGIVGARQDPGSARRPVAVEMTTRKETLESAECRHAPASNCASPVALDPSTAFGGKPCEVSAIRAGTPSQHATDDLVAELGVATDEPVRDLGYRGHGWPGNFTVVRNDKTPVETSYDESWGRHLGSTAQWRCKICPDGVGESADVTAADFWRPDDRGYPDFSEGDCVSALIARTRRGYNLVMAAADAGILALAPIDVDALAAVQPLQRARRETLAGRIAETVVAGGEVPRYTGFSLIRLALPRLREIYRTARGTFRRRRTASSNQ